MEYSLTNTKKKLKIDKHLPKIVLPNNKLKMFADWWNEDIRFEKTIPHAFTEGYLYIELVMIQMSDACKKLISLSAKKYHTTYRNIEAQFINFLKILNNVIMYFKFTQENMIIAEIYGSDEYIISRIECVIGENTTDDKIYLYEDNIDIFETFKTCRTLDDISNIFSKQLIYYLATCMWYMATTSSNKKYIYEEKSPMIIGRKKGIVQISDTKYIRTPIYDLKKIKTIKVERLINRKKGWTYSHSFQVHGHYRHYKDGKTIFIESYIKGKDKPFKPQTTVLNPNKIKEE